MCLCSVFFMEIYIKRFEFHSVVTQAMVNFLNCPTTFKDLAFTQRHKLKWNALLFAKFRDMGKWNSNIFAEHVQLAFHHIVM